jgi:hypothetical protein
MDTRPTVENTSAIRPSSEGRPARVRLGSDGRSFRIRSRASNDPKYIPKQPNLRAQTRRRRDLITAFLSALGPSGLNDLTQVMVRRAAELTVAVEMARADMLNGVPTDMLALVRLEGVASRAVRQLGLRVEPPPARARGLEIARLRWEAQRAQEKAKKAATEAAGEASATHTPEPSDGRAA